MKIALIVFGVLLLIYAVWGRAWLKTKPFAQPFFAWIEPIELVLWKKSETILFARLKMVTGFVLTLMTQFGQIDLTPFMPFVSPKWQPYVTAAVNLSPIAITVVGWMDEQLRKTTTKPLEVVAVPDDAPAAVKAQVAKVEATNAQAVAVVEASTAKA